MSPSSDAPSKCGRCRSPLGAVSRPAVNTVPDVQVRRELVHAVAEQQYGINEG